MNTRILSTPFITISTVLLLSSCVSDTVVPSQGAPVIVPVATQDSQDKPVWELLSITPDQSTTYTKTISYLTDHRKHTISTKYTLVIWEDGVIESIDASLVSGSHESARYHSRFNSAARSQIVGQKISELSLSAVGGASDTTEAFLDIVSAL